MLAFQILLLALSTLPLSLTEPLMPIQLITTFSTSTTSSTGPTCPTATITTKPSIELECLKEEGFVCMQPDKRCIIETTTTIPCDCPSPMPTVAVASPPCGACAVGCQTSWKTVTKACDPL
ncbi:hypothetical protein JMJ35_009217 [Cladonia borealis]|uniref:Uncharacterized protein n=1 Tax=Cladonia borealis TaxID=184061 RepID=A0AA39QUT4_9LECA|nr:hypothetical protein JMJ35_009217 [Cladonia borealis]